MPRAVVLLLLLTLPVAAQRVAFVDVTVVDGSGRAPFNATVLVDGERIADVVPRLKIPADYSIIDGRGKTLLPGLFDLHTHLPYSAASAYFGDWPQHLAAYLYSGVTTAVDFGSAPVQFEPMRKLLADGTVLGPRIHFAARLAPPYGHGMENGRRDALTQPVFTPRDAVAVIRELEPFKPDAVKLFTDGWRYGYADPMADMAAETIAAASEAAHKRGWEVLTHTVTVQGAIDAAAGKVDVIAHGVSDGPVNDRLIQLLRENGVTYAPTLAVYHPRGRDILDPLLDAVVPPGARERVKPPLRPPGPRPMLVGSYDDPRSPRARRWKNLVANNRMLHKAGVRFGAGTDAGVSNTWHGWSTQRELQLLVHAGLTPVEAIAAATGNAAEALNVADDRGVIAKGKLADLILVDGAPHKNIADIARLERVWLGGREVDRTALRELISREEPTPLPTRELPSLLDDFEQPALRSQVGTYWTYISDGGLDHAEILFQRRLRAKGDYALSIFARMTREEDSWAAAVLPLTPGEVTAADLTQHSGVQFEVRGQGRYQLLIRTRRDRSYAVAEAPFEAHPDWRKVRIPFARMMTPPADAVLLGFQFRRPAGETAWLELDDLKLF